MTPFVIWITGLPAAGKSSVANALVRELAARGQDVVVLESDALRRIYTPEPTFDAVERQRFYETVERLVVFLVERGVPVVVDATAHRREWRERARKKLPRFLEVYVDTPVAVCRGRDPKGLYDLGRAVQEGGFREDLFYRLMVLPIFMPGLRDRPGDVPALVSHFIDVFNREFRKDVRGATAEAMAALECYGWPGNIRELKNAVERAMLLADGQRLTAEDLRMVGLGTQCSDRFSLPPNGINFEELERDLVVQALERCGGNQTRAAALLGMNRDQVRYRMEKFGLDRFRRTSAG